MQQESKLLIVSSELVDSLRVPEVARGPRRRRLRMRAAKPDGPQGAACDSHVAASSVSRAWAAGRACSLLHCPDEGAHDLAIDRLHEAVIGQTGRVEQRRDVLAAVDACWFDRDLGESSRHQESLILIFVQGA